MPYIKHPLGKTFYLSKGRKRKDTYPLVGLHGGPGGTHLSLYSLTWLSERRKIVLFDQIGSGRSTPIDQKHQKIETFIEDLDRLIKELDLGDIHLLGSSWGTTLALEYYLHTKGKGLKSITFQSPMFSTKVWEKDAFELIKSMPEKYKKIIRYCHEIGATDSQVYRDAMKEYYKRHVYRLDKRPSWAPPRYSNTHGEKLYEYMWGPSEFKSTGLLKKYERRKELKKIKIPCLLMCGQYDEARPASVKKLAAEIPNSEVAVIKGASHSVFVEKPNESQEALEKFLRSVECQ